MTDSPEQLFADVVTASPSRPLVTYYDGGSGERTELSAKSLANWVAKTHFLLVDELGLGVGDEAVILAPANWITVPILLGCWSAGLSVVSDPAAAAVAFADADTLDRVSGVPDVFAVAPAAAARGFGGTAPNGAADYVVAIRPQPDAWATVRFTAAGSDPAIRRRSRADVTAQARARAAELALGPGARLLCAVPVDPPEGWIDALLAPLAVGGSLVLARDVADLDRLAAQERVTNRL